MKDKGFQQDLVLLLPRLRRFARGLTGTVDQADDLVQEACEKALRNANGWKPGTSLDSWMYKIVQNCWRDQLRSGHRRFVDPAPADLDQRATVDGRAELDSRLTLGAVRSALGDLDENQRVVLLLICVEGLSYADAAKALDCPVGTVMSRLARARVALHDMVEGMYSGDESRTVRRRAYA